MALKALSFEGLTYYHNKIKTLLSGKVDKEDGKGLSSNDYTTAEKTKLAGIETGADANVIETVQVNGSALSVTDKKVNVDLSAYALKSDISAVYRFKGNVATYADLPNTNQTVGDVYNVEEDGGNYAWTGETWDDLAGVVDLTEYYTKDEADGKYVNVTGDTMTGDLFIEGSASRWLRVKRTDIDRTVEQVFPESGTTYVGGLGVFDTNSAPLMALTRTVTPTNVTCTLQNSQCVNGEVKGANLNLIISASGDTYATAPTPSNTASNNTSVATTAWVNLADCVVHTTGNETIAGTKTFVNTPILKSVTCTNNDFTQALHVIQQTDFRDKDDVEMGHIRRYASTGVQAMAMTCRAIINEKVYNSGVTANITSDGTCYATAPATRETGYGSTDIATCGWVETKIATGGGEAITNDEIDSIFA